MKNVLLNLPTFGFIVSTRVALGVGIGLLLADRLSPSRRRSLSAALIGVGAATTVPALAAVKRSIKRLRDGSSVERDSRLAGATRFPRAADEAGSAF